MWNGHKPQISQSFLMPPQRGGTVSSFDASVFLCASPFLFDGEACQCVLHAYLLVCSLVRRNKAAGCTRVWQCLEVLESLWCVRSKRDFMCMRLCVCDIFALGHSGCVGLRYSMRLSTAVFSPFLKLFIQWHSLWLAAFQAEIPLAWKHNPGNSQLRISSAQLWQRRGSIKWDIKSLAVRNGVRECDGTRVAFIFPLWSLSKGSLGCSGFSLWLWWLMVTQSACGCAIKRIHARHICLLMRQVAI